MKNKICIIIPTYNNVGQLGAVIDSVLTENLPIIVVNDGSTDATLDILRVYETIEVISYSKNRGKGYALKCGFKRALQLGFDAVITFDSDGQHFVSDIEKFITAFDENPDSVVVGVRSLSSENMPQKNSFANKFSNFWFRLQTGIDLKDTQCGFRLYPIKKIGKIHLFSSRYEFELELLVRLSWRNFHIVPVGINVEYLPNNERITHFRPFVDFFRITILNTFLTLISIFYIYPRRFFLNVFSYKR